MSVRVKKAWVVTVNMGYGHQRAALPLLPVAEGGSIITANDYEDIPESDRRRWKKIESGYYLISRIKEHGGFIGEWLFRIFDRFQAIHEINDSRDERGTTFQLRQIYGYAHAGFGKHLIRKLSGNPVPILTTFFTVAHMADVWGYPGEVYIVTTDSDISRAWVSANPLKNNFRYCASTERVASHLKKYGVPSERVVVTGFPLPEMLTENAATDLRARVERLKTGAPITIMFAVGGAGVQAGIGADLIKETTSLLRSGKWKIILVTGKNEALSHAFEDLCASLGLSEESVRIMHARYGLDFFGEFNTALRTTDILWTKPSELSFYAALGIPIVMTPPVGAQEIRNREWLLSLDAGIDSPESSECAEWIHTECKKQTFAKMAQAGFDKIEKNGTRNILNLFN